MSSQKSFWLKTNQTFTRIKSKNNKTSDTSYLRNATLPTFYDYATSNLATYSHETAGDKLPEA